MNSPNILKFKNSFSRELKVILEPWAEEYSVKPGSTLEIVPNSESSQEIEIEYDGEDIIIYGWSDDMSVMSDGKQAIPFE